MSYKTDYVIVITNFLNLEGHHNWISALIVTVILLKGLIFLIGGVALGRVCVCSLLSRLVSTCSCLLSWHNICPISILSFSLFWLTWPMRSLYRLSGLYAKAKLKNVVMKLSWWQKSPKQRPLKNSLICQVYFTLRLRPWILVAELQRKLNSYSVCDPNTNRSPLPIKQRNKSGDQSISW